MHKDQYTDAPSQEQVRVKTMLNSTISMGYPDVVIACIEHQVSLEAFRAIEAAFPLHNLSFVFSSGIPERLGIVT